MKIFCVVACAALFSLPVAGQQGTAASPRIAASAREEPSAPAHPITLEQTRKMFSLMNFGNSMDSMMDRMISIQSQQSPFIPATVWDDMRATFKKTDFVLLFLPTYQKYLSEADAAKAIEFYATPAGRRMLKVLPPMMADISAVANEKGQEIARSVLERHMDEIQAAQAAYEQQHPEAAEPPAAPAESPK